MKELGKNLLGIAGYGFAGLLLAFTAMQTYALLYAVSGSHVTAVVGLILFEGGMLYWWQVFRRAADGLPQMAISLLMFIVGLLLVTVAVALHLGAVDAELLGSNTPARIIIIAVLLNLIAKLAFPLVSPEVFTLITERAHEGKILAGTYSKFASKIDDITDETSDDMAELWKERTRARITGGWRARLNKRAAAEGHPVEIGPGAAESGVNPTTPPQGGR